MNTSVPTGRPPARRVVSRQEIVRLDAGVRTVRTEALAGEEPMEIRVDGAPVAVTMRTPGNDFELALGFCVTEGILAAGDVSAIRYCDGSTAGEHNVVEVRRRVPEEIEEKLRRNVYTTSSCGVCGTTSIETVAKQCPSAAGDHASFTAAAILAMPGALRRQQRVFERTGGLHAAAVFTPEADVVCLREDVGRHNAVDKVIGWAAMGGALPLVGQALFVSGRVAFEIVQKAATAGIPVVAAVSAPTSLAVELAASLGVTLAGFVRGESMNVYTCAQRIV